MCFLNWLQKILYKTKLISVLHRLFPHAGISKKLKLAQLRGYDFEELDKPEPVANSQEADETSSDRSIPEGVAESEVTPIIDDPVANEIIPANKNATAGNNQ